MSEVIPSPIPAPDPQPDFTSKTFWWNLVVIFVTAGFYAVISSLTGTSTFSVKGADPNVMVGAVSLSTLLIMLKVAAASPAVIALANLILRYKTELPVTPFWTILSQLAALAKNMPKPPAPPAAAILFVAILLTSAGVFAGPPKAVITGPTTAIAGEILELDASGSTDATHFRWLSNPTVSGRRLIEPLADGKRARIASLPGTYTYTLLVSNPEGADITNHVVTIPGDPPSPGPSPAPPCPNPQPNPTPQPNPPAPQPTPVPVPNPEPSFPAGTFNVAGDTYRAAMAVKSANRAAEAKALAEATEAVAAQAAAGVFDSRISNLLTAKAVSNAMIEANRKALPNATEGPWQDFGKQAGEKASALYNAGKLKSGNDWAVLLRESAMGLRAAAAR